MRYQRPHARRTGLLVPKTELAKVDAAAILHRADEVLTSRGLSVMAIKIEVAAGAKPLRAEHQSDHTDQLGALIIDGRGIEVADFQIGFGPDRMRQRP